MRYLRILQILSALAALICPALAAAQSGAGPNCTGSSGSRFNLEPRTNAIVQVAESVALLPNRAGKHNIDLVVATATDARGLSTNPNATIIASDAFYVQRSKANCTPDFEGGEPGINNAINAFLPNGTPTAIADPAHDAFFIVDLMFAVQPDQNGVGIIRTDAATLLNTKACPPGTLIGTAFCWTTGAVVNITELNAFLSNPEIAVDPRKTGKGAGDVYTVVTQRDPNNGLHSSLSFTACTNANFSCSNAITVSGADLDADYGWIQVRPDGGITITYRNTSFPGINPEEIKFVTCKPGGAPNPPTCSGAALVTTEKNPDFAAFIGDANMTNVLFPKHVNRVEANGNITTFLVYDRCVVPVIPQSGSSQPFCPKVDVVVTSSTDDGASWSKVTPVSSAKGQQFFGAIADDTSTGTINIVYYSTENDSFGQRPQVFLVQIPPGSATVGGVHQLTTDFADIQASSPLSFLLQPAAFGDRIGVAAAGTGKKGQSHAYVSYTWNTVLGTYGGTPSPDVNNHLALFQY